MDNIFSERQWAQKQRWLINKLAAIKPDIIGFQEVFSPDALNRLVVQSGLPYFRVVDSPQVDSDHVYMKPVVAIASRFPIVSVESVEFSDELVHELKLQNGFSFSRTPIRSEVLIEGFGTVLVYVIHLKSKRSQFERELPPRLESNSEIRAHMLAEIHGRWASNIQRGTEASMIYQDYVEQMCLKERPTMILGDLNDTIESAALQQLVAGRGMDKLGPRYISSLSTEERRFIERFSLFDSYDLNINPAVGQRKPTHYFANKGSTLDYILLSKDFNSAYDHSLAEVIDYQVHDQHLQNPDHEKDAQCSDHAPVSVDVEVRF
ncbi:endonuclease/exonuclease/phosphatase family protein [Litoribacillus peritrichatus]|uniref:Endonuclease/exonuclease/phosphatase family protein n=1 Tax=Litoribacillus peritrichatus TaxID=718191 RepID=A0ABP7MY39_9GAMM